ncbi:class I SAM-dependent methyltransferase [Rhodanobacter glycinis]|uniref:Class I SAM-dependent methyltransferase n=1 Tax=Rhodanobacter glycinis TaxID=582702 RepID=A0A502CF01_9GAMM|nr:class I SAM-dependent methyltransferase [Rhodanobacter glycinis]TPG11204.1 class I SAM-dependent methyltransferase [Rhodanobacter glycinis]
MRIDDFSSTLIRNADGIYVASESRNVSYPTEGHTECFQVEDHSFWFRHRNECIGAMISRHSFDGTLLDIGGGNGYVSQMLAERGLDVALIEPGYAGALNARKRRGLSQVISSTVEDAGFPQQSIDAMGMFDVIEHIDGDRAFLAKMASLLKPGGRLYLTVPCHKWLWSQADVDACHFRRHTKQSLQVLLDGLFEIDYQSYFFGPLVLPQFLLRAVPFRLGLGRKPVLSTEAEHGAKSGPLVGLLNKLLAREARKIRMGKRLRFGASCLLAARRI